MIIDVRSHAERAEGFVCGSVHVPTPSPPLDYDQAARLGWRLTQAVERNRVPNDVIYTYCRKGIRAGIAQEMLWRIGVNSVSLGGVEGGGPLREMLRRGELGWCIP